MTLTANIWSHGEVLEVLSMVIAETWEWQEGHMFRRDHKGWRKNVVALPGRVFLLILINSHLMDG